jgi:hypothetical protein
MTRETESGEAGGGGVLRHLLSVLLIYCCREALRSGWKTHAERPAVAAVRLERVRRHGLWLS